MYPQKPIQTPCEVQAKEKLSQYVYEFLQLSGATKTAEAYKQEVMNSLPNTSSFKTAENGPGFLQNWWLVFWDVYCAAPERRDDPQAQPPTQEAKYFYENFVTRHASGPQTPMMNGMHGMFPGRPMIGPDGMMGPGFPGRGVLPGGMGVPSGDPRMNVQRMGPNAMTMQNAPFAPAPGIGQNPGVPPPDVPFGRPGFMDSTGMVPNGIAHAGQMQISAPVMTADFNNVVKQVDWACNLCPRKGSCSAETLNRVKNGHVKTHIMKYECKICGYRSASDTHMTDHIIEKHQTPDVNTYRKLAAHEKDDSRVIYRQCFH